MDCRYHPLEPMTGDNKKDNYYEASIGTKVNIVVSLTCTAYQFGSVFVSIIVVLTDHNVNPWPHSTTQYNLDDTHVNMSFLPHYFYRR